MNQERPASTGRRFFTLLEVTSRIREILAPAMERRFWLKAEISDGRFRNGHFYCDLVEVDKGGKQLAQIRCTLWRSQLSLIKATFQTAGLDFSLENGTQVGIECKLNFSPVYGLSVEVTDADPEFALGSLELRRRQLLLKLEKENLFEPNRRLSVPVLPQRIGLITSAGSAASEDFTKTLLQSGFGFTVLLADSVMQGLKSESSILKSIEQLERASPDLIVFIRGGGSKSDLSYLDNEAVARKIAACKLPVWTGIGHETDESVLDYVANRSFKTPTAAANAIVERYQAVQKLTDSARERLGSRWATQLESNHQFLSRSVTGLRQGTRKLLELTTISQAKRNASAKEKVMSRLNQEQQRLSAAIMTLKGSASSRVADERLKRGINRSELFRLAGGILRGVAMKEKEIQERLTLHRYRQKIEDLREALTEQAGNLKAKAARRIDQERQALSKVIDGFTLQKATSKLDSLGAELGVKLQVLRTADPANSLARGFSLVYDSGGKLVTSIRQVSPHDSLVVQLADGKLGVTVERGEDK
jgi:exodeoxyribonuclease VII large subunit